MNKEDMPFHFAMSSFARMFGVKGVTLKMKTFCKEWATWGASAPLESLTEVDQYFYHEFKNWS